MLIVHRPWFESSQGTLCHVVFHVSYVIKKKQEWTEYCTLTNLRQRGNVIVSVCLSVRQKDYTKTTCLIYIQLGGGVEQRPTKKSFNSWAIPGFKLFSTLQIKDSSWLSRDNLDLYENQTFRKYIQTRDDFRQGIAYNRSCISSVWPQLSAGAPYYSCNHIKPYKHYWTGCEQELCHQHLQDCQTDNTYCAIVSQSCR